MHRDGETEGGKETEGGRETGRWRNRMIEKELVKRQSCAAAGRAV